MTVHKRRLIQIIVKQYGTDNKVAQRKSHRDLFYFFSSRALLLNMQRSLPVLHSMRSRASRYRTVLPRSLALGALGARIRFRERSAAAKVSILKTNDIKNLYSHAYYKYHTRIAHRSQMKISTRQRDPGKLRALRTRPVYSPTRSRCIYLG